MRLDFALILSTLIAVSHVLGFISSLHAINKSRTPQGAMAWVLSLNIIPWLTLPFYWVFGRNRFHGYIEALRQQQPEKAPPGQATELHRQLAPFAAHLPPTIDTEFAVLEKLSRTPFTTGNHIELLIDGENTFSAIFAAIDSAKVYVLVQFFIIKHDQLGKKLRHHLIAKVKSGVPVCLLYDEIGSHALPFRYLSPLVKAGVSVSAFNSTRGPSNHFQLNFRNHRKIVVIDGQVGFLGGLNVGDEYMGKGRLGHWRDTHLRLQGPVVQSLQKVFSSDWYWATRQLLKLNWDACCAGKQTAMIYPSGPADELETCSMLFHQAIVASQHRLWIASPYFVPSLPVMDMLQLAALRGVDVRILLPSKPDHKLVYLSSFSFLEAADLAGIKIYRYQKGFLHQKVILVDDDFTAIGTANLDNRSLRLNFEVMAVTVDKAFAQSVANMLEQDFACSRQTSYKDLSSRSCLFQWAVRAARLFDPIL
ncbi:MAG: cardiolipin synthase [Proteobacteria bacterium]|nr:MAG: cardiolipin synthase [Pseudomonadota bacterium]